MKDLFCAYYTECPAIVKYMVRRLCVQEKDRVLEPAAGNGIFLDAILSRMPSSFIDAMELDPVAAALLKEKYAHYPTIQVHHTDTLFELSIEGASLQENIQNYALCYRGVYDKVIGNPPFGAWQDYAKREQLKKKFPGFYVKETYALFLLRALSALKLGGRMVFIVPDSFLYVRRHEALRKTILQNSEIEEIVLFPSWYFPGLQFGYAKLCIITLKRVAFGDAFRHEFPIIAGLRSREDFYTLLSPPTASPVSVEKHWVCQKDLLAHDQARFNWGDTTLRHHQKRKTPTLADVADVVTGLCTGDNHKYLRVRDHLVSRSKGYRTVNPTLIYQESSIQGVATQEAYIPYVKTAPKARYARPEDTWFIRWDRATIEELRQGKKARFQNASFYFQTGIGIPMIKARAVRAFLLKNRLFDQAIVGIFPKDLQNLYYLLALMNSSTMNRLIHQVNPTANNSANYIKKLPYLEPTRRQRTKIERIVKKLIHARTRLTRQRIAQYELRLDRRIGAIYATREKEFTDNQSTI